jgi:coenzyme F420 hydrogenase subunit beta
VAPTVQDIVEAGLCMGCGACEAVTGSERLQVRWDLRGACRPHILTPLDAAAQARIRAVCPGLRMELRTGDGRPSAAGRDRAAVDDVVFGHVEQMVEAYAADPQIRFTGSSGGVLTALAAHLLETGKAAAVLHVAASATHPLRTEAQVSRTRDEVLRAAGARYGPAAPLTPLGDLVRSGEPFAVIGKPCDIAAVRNLCRHVPRLPTQAVALLSLMCGGQAEQPFIWGLLEKHGIAEEQVSSFRCRGNGCPGPTAVETVDGRRVELTYEEVWGDAIHEWGLPFRCKICPDSQAEQADLMAFDSVAPEHVDVDNEGYNSVIVRTRRGRELLREAVAAGALTVTGDLRVEALYEWQEHIVRRREGVLARLAGTTARNGVLPRVSGYRLGAAARREGLHGFARNAWGAWRRAGRARECLLDTRDRVGASGIADIPGSSLRPGPSDRPGETGSAGGSR